VGQPRFINEKTLNFTHIGMITRDWKAGTRGMVLALCMAFLLCTAMTCEGFNPYEHACVLENQSDDTILVAQNSYSGTEKPASLYTMFRGGFKHSVYKVAPGETYFGIVSPVSEELMDDCRYQVVVLRQSTVDKYGIEKLIKVNRCDTTYDLSYAELEAMDFKIVYRGD
jgi:hypothetical protein